MLKTEICAESGNWYKSPVRMVVNAIGGINGRGLLIV